MAGNSPFGDIARRETLIAWEAGWKDVAQSVQRYLPVANNLREQCDPASTLSAPQKPSKIARSNVKGASVDDVCLEIDKKLAELIAMEEQLRLSRSSLQSVRNQSSVLVPIHRLPPECLSLIFIFGSEDNTLEGIKGPDGEYEEEDGYDDDKYDEVEADGDDGDGDAGDAEDAEDGIENEDDGEAGEWTDEDSQNDEDEEDEGDEVGEWSTDSEGDDEEFRAMVSTIANAPRPFCTTVSQICRHWRNIALTTGQLWTYIDFADSPPFHLTKLWLERSKQCPLDVRLDSVEGLNLRGHSWLNAALEVLRPHMSRCTNLGVRTQHEKFTQKVISEFIGSPELPRFKTFALVGEYEPGFLIGRGESERLDALVDIMRGVRYLELEGVLFPWTLPVYENLVTLRLSVVTEDVGPTPTQFERILRCCPSLEVLELDEMAYCVTLFSETKSGEGAPSKLELTSLETIRLAQLQPRVFTHVAGLITAPSLRDLTVHSSDPFDFEEDEEYTDDVLIGCLTKFLTGSNQSLTHFSLRLRGEVFTTTLLVSLMRNLPCITSLRLSHVWHAEDMIKHMASERLCPKLESLTLVRCASVKLFQPLQDMITRSDRQALKSLVVKYCGLTKSDVAWLKERVAEFESAGTGFGLSGPAGLEVPEQE